jgi:molybdopterin-synthase adenylyltransferase
MTGYADWQEMLPFFPLYTKEPMAQGPQSSTFFDAESRDDALPAEPSLSPADRARYSRQILFAGIGEAGQQRLRHAHVAIVGCGATGAASASLLARAGIGKLTLIDRDFVEESNLQRQVLFDEADARDALPKAEAARRKLAGINAQVKVEAHVADLTPANIVELLSGADLLLDATDNFETRYLLNDYAVSSGKPWMYAAAVGAYTAGMTILPGETACLACIFPDPPTGAIETCETAGILNSVANIAAAIQVTEALKLLTGATDQLRRTLLAWDVWANQRSEIAAAHPRPDCEVCGLRRFRHLTGEGRPHITLCGRNSVQIHETARPLDLAQLIKRLEPLGEVRGNSMMLRFRVNGLTLGVFADGRAIIQGTTDPAIARSLYARYIGS